MVRKAGIPARVAFGFTRGNARDGQAYVLTNRNAHAWTEVYFDGIGWVPFDATPASGVPGSARAAYAPDVDAPTPTASAPSAGAQPGTDPSAAPSAGDLPQHNRSDLADGGLGGTGVQVNSTRGIWIAIIAAVLIALLLVPALRRVLVRRHRHAATAPKKPAVLSSTGASDLVVTTESSQAREDAHAAWDELLDTMIDFRIPIDPSETPRVTAQRLIKDAVLQPDPSAGATLLGTAEERARYARKPLQGAELTRALTQVRKGVARSANRRTRIAAVIMPPSVLLRWRLALGEGNTRLMAAGGRMGEVLARFSPRRLLASRKS
jgi:hypothetical protein